MVIAIVHDSHTAGPMPSSFLPPTSTLLFPFRGLGVRLSYLPIHVGPAPSGCPCVVHSAPIHFIPSLFLHILLQKCLRFPPGSESARKRSMQQLFTPRSARKHRAQARTRVGEKYSKAPVMCSQQPGPAC